MQVFENRTDLSAIESKEASYRIKIYLRCLIRIEVTNSSMIREQITTTQELCCKVDITIVLEKSIVV